MHYIWKIILVLSLILNVIAIWGFFHYIKYGGSPLGELKRLFKGAIHQKSPSIPYAEDNARIKTGLKTGSNDRARVVFLGASITRGWKLEAYFPEIEAINRGVGGQYVPQLLTRFKGDVIELEPDAVVIKFCSINIRPQIPGKTLTDAMEMMVQLARSNEIIPIICTIIPPAKPEAHIGDFSIIDSTRVFNDWLREYARENNLALIDYDRAIADDDGFLPRRYSSDPVHVNEDGYVVMAETAKAVIYEVLSILRGNE